jgi:hypothetical protein
LLATAIILGVTLVRAIFFYLSLILEY